MESTVNRRAVDVGQRSSTPLIAFVLALLSLPGSTIAWDLPAGGLWIGLPLGLAAILLGIRSRREGSGSKLALAAIVLAALAIGQMVVYSAVLIVT